MDSRVLVVGTTSDYIEWISRSNPSQALFISDRTMRKQAAEPSPFPKDEILVDLNNYTDVRNKLLNHLNKWAIRIDGITCFDCESLELTAWLAEQVSLFYPSIESIRLCRNKYSGKHLWQKNSVPCPRARIVSSAAEICNFLQEIRGPCVIKPLRGSGSELVFFCSDNDDCRKWSSVMRKELQKKHSHRPYNKDTNMFLAEEFIEGNEYSCDFIIADGKVSIIRLTRKIKEKTKLFGTISGYALCNDPPVEFPPSTLENTLYRGATTLGITHAVCMVDFIVKDSNIVLIEMTPRPGGDCIPHLMQRSGAADTLSLTLNFARQKHFIIPEQQKIDQQNIGLRLHAYKEGIITSIDTTRIKTDSRVREIQLIRQAGHHITMPPMDYDSWYLGHVIFKPDPGIRLEHQLNEIRQKIDMEII